MPSSRNLRNRPDIWKADLAGRLSRLHLSAQDAEAAYAEVESRDTTRARRDMRRRETAAAKYPAVRR